MLLLIQALPKPFRSLFIDSSFFVSAVLRRSFCISSQAFGVIWIGRTEVTRVNGIRPGRGFEGQVCVCVHIWIPMLRGRRLFPHISILSPPYLATHSNPDQWMPNQKWTRRCHRITNGAELGGPCHLPHWKTDRMTTAKPPRVGMQILPDGFV